MEKVNRGRYHPTDSAVVFVPKAGWMVRPGAVLHGEDELVFNALLGRLQRPI
jgi:hypothetical protein